MNTVKKLINILVLILLLSACDDTQTPTETNNLQAENSTPLPTQSVIPVQPVKGILRDQVFQIEQARLKNGVLELRQGKDFFADKSISIFTFESESLDNKTIKVDSNTGFGTPHIHLAIKHNPKDLPDTKIMMEDYEMQLSFANADELGIPFTINLVTKDARTNVKGRFFATFDDLLLQNGQVDRHYDSFDTLGYLTRQYLHTQSPDIQWHKRFGSSYLRTGESSYPQVGFIGYEVSIAGAAKSLVKVQLYKDENGWRVVNQLAENQIHQAHPVAEYKITNKQKHAAKVVAALALEKELNQQSEMPKVRSTSFSCTLTKNKDKASCRGVYGVREADADDVVCKSKNYLLQQTNQIWQVEKAIADNEKVDYKSGVLKTYKPFDMHCTG